ncbi:MAG: SPOR domain-containing protein [Sphingobium sp.]
MTDRDGNGLKLGETERRPWLEPAGEIDHRAGSPGKIVGLAILALLLVVAIMGGSYVLRSFGAHDGSGEGKLIRAEPGDYKVAIPGGAEDKGKRFKGTGDTLYATSEGVDLDGHVDLSRMPEAPLDGISRGSVVRDVKPGASAAIAAAPSGPSVAGPAAPAPTHGAMVQLGAYRSESGARDAWKTLSKRFDYLALLPSMVEKADVGGSTVYRLLAGAGGAAAASTLCGRLKVAGETCIVVN